MSTVNQKEYLKRYLSKGKDKKKKKKKDLKGLQNRVKIIDDNIDVHEQVQTIQDIENGDEDAPQVVSVIDDRPVELRMNSFKDSSNWTSIDIKPKIKVEPESPERNRRNDHSPSRRNNERSDDESPPRRKNHHDADESPLRKNKRYDSDESPPRKHKRNSPRRSKHDDYSPPRRLRYNSPSTKVKQEDESPPRRQKHVDKSSQNVNYSPTRRSKRDSSPPRRRNNDSRHQKSDSSPPRRQKTYSSPPRKTIEDSSPRQIERRVNSSNRSSTRKSRWASKSPSPEASTSTKSSKATKTLDGKTAGLQNAKDLVKETENFRKREAKLFEEMAEEVSGVNATTVMRDRKTGRLRDLEAEALEKSAHKEKTNELQKKYDKWGKGVKQTEDYNQKLQETAYEMSKPLARYADDVDLERHLKEQLRADDPMLAFIKQKKREDAVKSGVKLKPEYMGEFMPNRYGIRPGHRWDGVDRSNGYEKKWFDAINKRNAEREEAYRWNSEDM